MPVRDTPWAPGTPCWIDLMTDDQPAAHQFYSALFGWKIDVGPEETGGYGMASIDGRSVAGIGGMMGLDHPPAWNTYLATADAEATSKEIEAAGGSIVTPVMDVMEFGRMAVALVPGGGAVSIWQSGQHGGFGIANESNTDTWNEFMTRDLPVATQFYSSVFGYTYTNVGDESMPYSTIEVDGQTVGGIGQLPEAVPEHVPPHWRVYFAVDDTDAAVARVTELGGSVLRPPTDMPDGRQADVADPQGAMFSLIKPAPGPNA